MKKLDVCLKDIPNWKIVIAATSEPDYEMDRTLLVEDYPTYDGNFIIIHGYHCSCYGFDDTEWEALQYTKEELLKLATGWLEKGYGSERLIAPPILNYVKG